MEKRTRLDLHKHKVSGLFMQHESSNQVEKAEGLANQRETASPLVEPSTGQPKEQVTEDLQREQE